MTKRKKRSRFKPVHHVHVKKPNGYGKRMRTMKGFAIRGIMEGLAAQYRRNKKRVPPADELRRQANELYKQSKAYNEGGRAGLLG